MSPILATLIVPALWAIWNVYGLIRVRLALHPLPREAVRDVWPRISLIVPACNEGETIEAATKAKLASDYPNLEIVLVDDRSTDATGAILDRLSANDDRVRVLHIDELPAGWLGKVHAMHRGVEKATGDWLLFCDADVHMGKSLLRRVITHAEDNGIDNIALMPLLWPSTFATNVVFAAVFRMLFVVGRLWSARDPRSRAAFGNGTFNLARRSVYEKTPGFEWLRLEILDDQVFGQMMKRAGGRFDVLDAKNDLALHFYRTLGEMMRALEKNGYVLLGQLRPHRFVAAAIFMASVELGPAIALAFEPLRLCGALLLGVLVLVQILLARMSGRSIVPALVPCVGTLVFLSILVRATILVHARGGISWRGTFYPLDALRKGQRLELV